MQEAAVNPIQNLTGYTLTVFDVAKKLGYHPQYVRFLASQGKIPALKRIRQWLFNEKELTEFFAKQTKTNQNNLSDGTHESDEKAGVTDLLS